MPLSRRVTAAAVGLAVLWSGVACGGTAATSAGTAATSEAPITVQPTLFVGDLAELLLPLPSGKVEEVIGFDGPDREISEQEMEQFFGTQLASYDRGLVRQWKQGKSTVTVKLFKVEDDWQADKMLTNIIHGVDGS